VFYDYWKSGDVSLISNVPSKIEGIGRPRVEPSFVREAIDEMIKVPDLGSVASLRVLSGMIGKRVGGSTGTNFYVMLTLAFEMIENQIRGSIVGLLCDSGERYLKTYFDDNWVKTSIGDIDPFIQQINRFLESGESWEELDFEE